MSLRDDLLGVFDSGRQLIDELGLRRYTLTIRTRTWSGDQVGSGTATDDDLTLSPSPRVRVITEQFLPGRENSGSGGMYRDGDFRVDRITPAFTEDEFTIPVQHGYTPAQLKPLAEDDSTEILYLLEGDDGTIECELVSDSFDRAFGYQLVLRQTRRTP